MNVFAILSRTVGHWAFKVFVFVLVIAAATVSALHATISSMANQLTYYEKMPDLSTIPGSVLVGLLIGFIFISPACIHVIFKNIKINACILLPLLSLSTLYSYQEITGEFTPRFHIHDYSFVGEYWPIIQQVSFNNAVTNSLYGAVFCVLLLRIIDTGSRLLTHLIAEAEARG